MNDSKNKEQKIQALTFNAPGSTQSDELSDSAQSYDHARLEVVHQVKWWHSQFNLMLSVFALLALAALLFILLSPAPSHNSSLVLNEASDSIPNGVEKQESNAEEAPWDEARRAQARVDSQDILSGLLNRKKLLEAQGVTEWAADTYTKALEHADLGDSFYKQQDYRSAIDSYQNALGLMQDLQEGIPEIIDARIKEGLFAIDQGKSILAKQLFGQALTLDKNNIPALKGLGRAETLDQVLDLYAQGQQFEQRFKTDDLLESLSQADQKYQKVLSLDKEYTLVQEAIDRVALLEADKRYRNFMTTGFNSLFAKRYTTAKNAFSKALKIKPNESTAKEAYVQSISSNKSASLTSLLNTAKKHETVEEWSAALSGYQAVLQRDTNQVSAKLGQIRSRIRSDLDTRLLAALSDPLALSKGSVRDKANQALADAKGISKKGTRLKQQISQLESALKNLSQTIKVVFLSDEKTEISLVKVGSKRVELGVFKSKKLVLKPGRYIVRGSRLGFHDVRQEIDVLPGVGEIQPMTIQCTKPVNHTPEVKTGLS